MFYLCKILKQKTGRHYSSSKKNHVLCFIIVLCRILRFFGFRLQLLGVEIFVGDRRHHRGLLHPRGIIRRDLDVLRYGRRILLHTDSVDFDRGLCPLVGGGLGG